MYQSQQQLQQSSFAYLSHSSNPTPSPVLLYPQPPTVPSEPFLYPPGTDPYAYKPQFSVTHVAVEAQAQIYEDPNGASQSWITRQADPIRYDATVSFFLVLSFAAVFFFPLIYVMDLLSVAASNSNNGSNQSLVNNVISASDQTAPIQPMRCEVCNIECQRKDVYEKHITGKKHRRKLQEKISSSTAILPEYSNAMLYGASCVANAEELERKKQKLLDSGAAVNSVRMCTICNVACNSHEVFVKHLSGRRHAAQAGLIADDGVGPYLAAVRANDQFWNKGKKASKVVQSSWCEVCEINCNSGDAYAQHLSGKKHLKKLENLEKSKKGTSDPSMGAPAEMNQMIKPVENPAASSSDGGVSVQNPVAAQPEAPKEDLETKRRKVMEGGTAAADVRVCTICNVVCNSEKVFKYHLTGQKHAAMVKKQAATTS
ncbi:zinc finger RNA-binding protein-like [Gossypium australe]|uniref:Zinc finger RNA-binding protein-like n=1 Tax=Gossypium australe TaxID=47621 RepID=A0A5B6UPI9_9ROSI|nr:zinc finger RNA-binding protein-like [Gossypium australe]